MRRIEWLIKSQMGREELEKEIDAGLPWALVIVALLAWIFAAVTG